MKKILLWDPRFPGRSPQRLEVDDAIASACVRATVAAAADPAEAGALGSGGTLSAADPVTILIQHGPGKVMRRVTVPDAVAVIAVATGLAAYTAARPVVAPAIPAPILVASYSGNLFTYNGATYANEAALLAAAGGVKLANAITFGPLAYGSELLTNGDFAGGTTGWLPTAGALGSVAAGEYTLTGNGQTRPGFYQTIPIEDGQAYTVVGKIKMGVTDSPFLYVSSLPDLSKTLAQGTVNNTTNYIQTTRYFGSFGGADGTAYVGGKLNTNPSNGQAVADDYSVRKVIPFTGLAPKSVSFSIEATTAATAAGTQVLAQIDNAGQTSGTYVPIENNLGQVAWNAAGELHVIVYADDAAVTKVLQADLNLGVVAPGTAFKVQLTFAKNAVVAKLNANAPIADTSCNFPAMAALRLRRSQKNGTDDWLGSVEVVKVYSGKVFPSVLMLGMGDSYVDGSDNVSFKASLAASTGYGYAAIAQGGSNMTQQAGYLAAAPNLIGLPNYSWDGDCNGYGTVAAYVQAYKDRAAIVGRETMLVLPPLRRPSTAIDNADRLLIANELATFFAGGHYYDPHPLLQSMGNGSTADNNAIAANQAPPSVFLDGTHLNQAAMTAVANASAPLVQAIVAAMGYPFMPA